MRSEAAPHRELYSGLVRLHVLYHAAREPIFGLQMIEELGRHGYKISPGAFYPLLHGMERRGLLRSSHQGRLNHRRVYRATPEGRKALEVAKRRVRELFRELWEDFLSQGGAGRARRSAGRKHKGAA
ncbi:MAG: PadR family transcriptional regulator [Acidobacteria bacterium]|nr:PadR family transcriptional regulator [Acidobacteriota bacterium]